MQASIDHLLSTTLIYDSEYRYKEELQYLKVVELLTNESLPALEM